MPENTDEINTLKLVRAKSKATAKTIKLLIYVQGSFTLVLARILTVILSTTMHLNAPLVFVDSLVGHFILIRQRLFPESSPGIREVEKLMAPLPPIGVQSVP